MDMAYGMHAPRDTEGHRPPNRSLSNLNHSPLWRHGSIVINRGGGEAQCLHAYKLRPVLQFHLESVSLTDAS